MNTTPNVASVVHSSIFHSAWIKIQKTLMDCMNDFVSSYSGNPTASQVLFKLCGPAFTSTYYPTANLNAYILEEPYMIAETRRDLEAQLYAAIVQFLDSKLVDLLHSDPEVLRLLAHMRQDFKRPCVSSTPDNAAMQLIHLLHGAFFRCPTVELPPNPPATPPPFAPTILWNQTCSEYYTDKFLNDQANTDEDTLFQSLRVRSVPLPLRQLLWFRRLHRPDAVADHSWRLKANQTLLGTNQPWLSPVSTLIFRLVRESLADRFPHAVDVGPRLCDLLNVWFVLTKLQSSHFVSLAIPLVRLFPSFDSKSIELASCLLVFLQTYHIAGMSRSEVAAASQRVWRSVGERFPSVFRHIEEVIAQSRLDMPLKPADLFTSWLQVALVGYIRPAAADFIWDQCMLSPVGWKAELDKFCVDIVSLLIPRFMSASSVEELQTVVDSEPRKLLTRDVRCAMSERCQIKQTPT
ncbi:hypothetical protein AC1031_018661 [Aphanomyces cochlioides]|nr:hypothetical protein AC1031_018661 [Aphanomyces cochlioides]